MRTVQTIDTRRELLFWTRKANANITQHGYVLPGTMARLDAAKAAVARDKSEATASWAR